MQIMADVKVNELKYYDFLSMVKKYIEDPGSNEVTEDLIKDFINKEQTKRDLMFQRKAYYDFYVANKEYNPEEANSAYRKYSEVNGALSKIRKKEKYIIDG